jgi:hypothetical protein
MEHSEFVRLSLQSELSQSELENLKHGSWEVDCPKIIIRSCNAENPLIFEGAGFLKQIASRQLVFKLYVNTQIGSQSRKYIQRGERIPNENYFDFIALDYQGRVWSCERILINSKKASLGELIVQANLPRITSHGEMPKELECKGSTFEIHVFDDINIPQNQTTIITKSISGGRPALQSSLNIWEFQCCNLKFRLIKEDSNHLIINFTTTEEDIPKYLKERVLEAFQFILGYPIHWATSHKRIGNSTELTLSSPERRLPGGRFQPPVLLGGYLIEEDKTFQELFTKYLRHIIDYDQPQHPFWAQLNAIYEASNGKFIDAHALTLSVAIESLVSLEFPNLGEMTEEEKDAVKEALEYVGKWGGHTGIKNRIIGSVKSYSHPSISAKMKALVKAGAITKKHWTAWQNIRNKSAHSYQSHRTEGVRFVDDIFQVNVLFYHLIFHAIGYQGSYMDTSVVGFPVMKYPPEKSA